MRIAVRRPKGCLDDAHARPLEQVPDTDAPFPISIADQEASGFEHAVGCIRELAYDLQHEGLVRKGRRDDPDSPRVQFDDNSV